MNELLVIAGAASAVSLAAGCFLGAIFTDRRLKRHYEDIRGEVVRLRAIAENKLSGDDPNFSDLLRDLSDAVDGTFKAAEALANQSAVIARKTEGGEEVVRSSRHIVQMIEEYSGELSVLVEQRPDLRSDNARQEPSLSD